MQHIWKLSRPGIWGWVPRVPKLSHYSSILGKTETCSNCLSKTVLDLSGIKVKDSCPINIIYFLSLNVIFWHFVNAVQKKENIGLIALCIMSYIQSG